MTVFGVPLGHVLARGRLPGRQLLISLVFLPMVVPGLAGGILLLLSFGPYGTLGAPLAGWGISPSPATWRGSSSPSSPWPPRSW